MISGFEKNLLGSRGVEGLYSEESGEKELDGKGSSFWLSFTLTNIQSVLFLVYLYREFIDRISILLL